MCVWGGRPPPFKTLKDAGFDKKTPPKIGGGGGGLFQGGPASFPYQNDFIDRTFGLDVRVI